MNVISILIVILAHLAGDNTVMLKKPLCSPISVLKEPKAGTSKIHRNSRLPLRTLKNVKKKKKNQQGRNLNSETKCKSQIWWFSVTMGEFPRGVGWKGLGWSEMVSLVDFYVSLIFIFHILQHFLILKSIVSDYHIITA